jgi:hypothetical protein
LAGPEEDYPGFFRSKEGEKANEKLPAQYSLSTLNILVIFSLSYKPALPPRSVPILIKELDGRVLAGEIVSIYEEGTMIKLEKVCMLEVIGLKEGLEPIFSYKKKSIKYASIRTDEIVHWELLPDYLKVHH